MHSSVAAYRKPIDYRFCSPTTNCLSFMDSDVQQTMIAVANSNELHLQGNVTPRIDDYIAKHFSVASAPEKRLIQIFLSDAAIRIALSESKHEVTEEDVKAAIWLFHVPTDPDDTCKKAGENILRDSFNLKAKLLPAFHSISGSIGGGAAVS